MCPCLLVQQNSEEEGGRGWEEEPRSNPSGFTRAAQTTCSVLFCDQQIPLFPLFEILIVQI